MNPKILLTKALSIVEQQLTLLAAQSALGPLSREDSEQLASYARILNQSTGKDLTLEEDSASFSDAEIEEELRRMRIGSD